MNKPLPSVDAIKADWRSCVWAHTVSEAEAASLLETMQFTYLDAGGALWRRGDRSEHWMGLIAGAAKLCTCSPDGAEVTFTGVAYGWIGEDGLLMDAPRTCDATALTDCLVGRMPRKQFLALLDTNKAFNRFVLQQQSQRCAQLMELMTYQRTLDPVGKVAHSLGALFNDWLFPPRSLHMAIAQAEIAALCAMSRARTNLALKRLEAEGLLALSYQRITVLNLPRLRSYRTV